MHLQLVLLLSSSTSSSTTSTTKISARPHFRRFFTIKSSLATNSYSKNTQRTKIYRLNFRTLIYAAVTIICNNYFSPLLPSPRTPEFTNSYTKNTQRPEKIRHPKLEILK